MSCHNRGRGLREVNEITACGLEQLRAGFKGTATMAHVLPGEVVPAQHVNLKLGPGLLQASTSDEKDIVISTRAGEVQHTANNRQWWIESNSRRVSFFCLSHFFVLKRKYTLVCPCATRICGWSYHCTQRRRMASRHRFCSYGLARRSCL